MFGYEPETTFRPSADRLQAHFGSLFRATGSREAREVSPSWGSRLDSGRKDVESKSSCFFSDQVGPCCWKDSGKRRVNRC